MYCLLTGADFYCEAEQGCDPGWYLGGIRVRRSWYLDCVYSLMQTLDLQWGVDLSTACVGRPALSVVWLHANQHQQRFTSVVTPPVPALTHGTTAHGECLLFLYRLTILNPVLFLRLQGLSVQAWWG